jgi:hypothetical protein
MLAVELSDLFQEAVASPYNCFRWRVYFFTIVVLFKRSPIVESSALTQVRRVYLFKHLRLERRLRSNLRRMRCRRGTDAEDHQNGKRRSAL